MNGTRRRDFPGRIQKSNTLLIFCISILLTSSKCNGAQPPCQQLDPGCDPVSALVIFAPRFMDRWVAVGPFGNLAYSSDGRTDWVNFSIGGGNLNAVTYATPGFVAVGDAGRIVLSLAGLPGTWTDQTSATADNLRDITYGKGLYVAVGGVAAVSARILTSTDGVTWTDRSNAIGNRLERVLFSNGVFYAAGQGGVLASSPDGITWTPFPGPPDPWTSLAFGNGIFMLTTDTSSIYTSASFSSLVATGSFGAAQTDATIFLPEQGVFVLAGDGGEVYNTTNGSGPLTQVDNLTGNGYDVDSDGTTTIFASQAGTFEFGTDATNFDPVVVGASDWFGIVHALVPEELDP